MQFIKTHLISLSCSTVGLLAIVITILGTTSTSVVEVMKKRVAAAGEISSLGSNPRNQKIIDAEKARGEAFDREFARALEEAKRINRREPLMPGVFPKPQQGATPLFFQGAYKAALAGLVPTLDAGGPPDENEIAAEQDNVQDLWAQVLEQTEEGGQAKPAITQNQPQTPVTARSPVRVRNPRMVMESPPSARTPRGMMLEPEPAAPGLLQPTAAAQLPPPPNEPKYNPTLRAQVAKARSIRCYATKDVFHESNIVDMNTPPSPADMWFAQVGLWIQQDIVDAIAALNEEAANQITTGEACVEQMPVKRIEAIELHGYVTPGGLLPFHTLAALGATGTAPKVSFTGRVCDDQFDVVRFGLTVIVDQRDVLKLIDRITRQNFYQCVGLEFQQAPEEPGCLYGTEPVARVKLDFEAYMARDVYREWMPPEVVKMLSPSER